LNPEILCTQVAIRLGFFSHTKKEVRSDRFLAIVHLLFKGVTEMSKKNKESNHDMKHAKGQPAAAQPAATKTTMFSHGSVATLDLDRARKELEKNKIEFKVEKGELFTVDNGDANMRNTAIKIVSGFKRKAG
jgi:hypothetical protein